jgi:cytochrome c-type biogenesis protein CcmH
MQTRPFWYSRWLLTVAICLLAVASVTAYAQSPGPTVSEQPELVYDEAKAHSIDQMIMCPVCPAETIDQAQVPVARQMRQVVRQMLSEGHTRDEILDFFAQRYGPDILAAPPKSGFNLLAWLIPVAAVVGALTAGVLVLRAMSSRKPDGSPSGPATSPSDPGLEEYLDVVDRELALDQPDRPNEKASGLAPVSVEPRREESSQDNG